MTLAELTTRLLERVDDDAQSDVRPSSALEYMRDCGFRDPVFFCKFRMADFTRDIFGANLFDLCGQKLGLPILSAACRPFGHSVSTISRACSLQAMFYRVALIFPVCNPFEIRWAIVGLVSVFVIDLIALIRQTKEGKSHKAMGIDREALAALIDSHPRPTVERRLPKNTIVPRVIVGSRIAHATMIANLVDSFIVAHWKPNFVAAIIHTLFYRAYALLKIPRIGEVRP